MGEANKHGLSRYITADVASQVRRECGFGCVLCGESVVDYEHIEPEFADARSHEPENIALLCDGCHGKVTRRIWSKEKVAEARKNPFCKKSGFSWGELDTGSRVPSFVFGSNLVTNVGPIFKIDDAVLFGTLPPEEPGSPFRVSAQFFDDQSQPIMKIVDNQWKLNSNKAWDFKHVGPRIHVRGTDQADRLDLLIAGRDTIVIERMRFTYHGISIEIDGPTFSVRNKVGGTQFFDSCRIYGQTLHYKS